MRLVGILLLDSQWCGLLGGSNPWMKKKLGRKAALASKHTFCFLPIIGSAELQVTLAQILTPSDLSFLFCVLLLFELWLVWGGWKEKKLTITILYPLSTHVRCCFGQPQNLYVLHFPEPDIAHSFIFLNQVRRQNHSWMHYICCTSAEVSILLIS